MGDKTIFDDSVRFSVPGDLADQAKAMARAEGRPLSEGLRNLLRGYVNSRQTEAA